MISKDLSALSSSEMKDFLNSFDTLKQCGKVIHFVSNNDGYGTMGMVNALKNYDAEVEVVDLITPSQAIISFLKKVKFNKQLYILGTSAMKEDYQNAGFVLANTKHNENEDSLKVLSKYTDDDPNIGAVICSYDVHLSNIKVIRCTAFLRRPEVYFITGPTDKKFHANKMASVPGPYFYQHAIMEVTGRVPQEFGKPSKNLHEYITTSFNIKDSSRILFVGDSITQDIKFGRTYGYQTLLVFTGITSHSDFKNIETDDEVPNYYLNSFGDLYQIIKSKLDI
ncbi:hypothetical protein RI129_010060 [Pyrocoelia pectoralis]|uniref:4-nitrophenylphosphatase n=1 Tax=Pyrocoelia pectoralis TaxID=417401 RepID=A0AAN7ZJG3_9COLE